MTQTILIIGGIIIFLAVVTMLQFLNYRNRKKLEQENLKMQQAYMEKQQLYEQNVAANQKLRQIRHDLKKQLRVIEEMNDSETDAIAVLIGGKKRYMDELGVQNNLSDVDVELLHEMKIKLGFGNVDMVNLLGNLFDNAIEACERLIDKGGRNTSICVEVCKEDEKVGLTISNSKSVNEVHDDDRYDTVKVDRENHGHGMKIIRGLVEKGQGAIKFTDYGDRFEVVVIK